ncbi:MAG TPA: preprotein translocase subunit YajC [bacterium]|nr:preprotein translocase subunit YajC [bacterium]
MLYAAEGVPAGAAAEGPSMLGGILPLIIIFALFYIMFIVPSRKEQKKHKEMLGSLKVGDKVVTNGGIVGIIDKINETDDVMRIKSAENTVINIKKGYIASKIVKTEEPEKK